MKYIAGHYNMDLALAWALRLEGKTDQEKFKALGCGLRTWDIWNFNERDERFGDDWPGCIPDQPVTYTLFYFTKPADLVLDPMAGGMPLATTGQDYTMPRCMIRSESLLFREKGLFLLFPRLPDSARNRYDIPHGKSAPSPPILSVYMPSIGPLYSEMVSSV